MQDNAFSATEKAAIEEAIKHKYQAVAAGAAGFFSYAVGKEGALRLGYDERLLSPLPEKVLNAFCGVGNPFSLGTIPPGSIVLDIGCGAGFDLYVASTLTGGGGYVFGVDLTYAMATRAQGNLSNLAVSNASILNACGDSLPLAGNSFDVVISNGAINLSPQKTKLFAEIHRVLKPGGKLHFADIILDGDLPAHLRTGVESWSQ